MIMNETGKRPKTPFNAVVLIVNKFNFKSQFLIQPANRNENVIYNKIV